MGAVKEEAEKLKAQIAEHKKRLMEEKGLSQRRPRRMPSWPSWSRRTTRSARSQALECLFRPMLNLTLTRRRCSCTVSLCENVLPPSGPHNVECGRTMCSCPHACPPPLHSLGENVVYRELSLLLVCALPVLAQFSRIPTPFLFLFAPLRRSVCAHCRLARSLAGRRPLPQFSTHFPHDRPTIAPTSIIDLSSGIDPLCPAPVSGLAWK